MLYRKPGCTIWYCRWRINGRLVSRSTGQSDKRAAAREGDRIKVELAAQRLGPARGARLIDLASWDAERSAAVGGDARRIATIENMWAQLLTYWAPGDLASAITYPDLERYIGHRRTHGYRGVRTSAQTIRRELSTLRRGMRLAKGRGHPVPVLDATWPRLARDPPNPKLAGKFHAPEVVRAVLATLAPDVRDLFEFVAMTGLRGEEARRVLWTWVDGELLRMPEGATKNGKPRVVGLSPRALEILRRRAGTVSPAWSDAPLFPQGSYATTVRAASRRAGLSRALTLRDLRHTWSTYAAREDLVGAAQALGHDDTVNLRHYQTAQGERAVAAAGRVADVYGSEVETMPAG